MTSASMTCSRPESARAGTARLSHAVRKTAKPAAAASVSSKTRRRASPFRKKERAAKAAESAAAYQSSSGDSRYYETNTAAEKAAAAVASFRKSFPPRFVVSVQRPARSSPLFRAEKEGSLLHHCNREKRPCLLLYP